MDRVAVFVDAGYLFAQGSVALAGKKTTRSGLPFLSVKPPLEESATEAAPPTKLAASKTETVGDPSAQTGNPLREVADEVAATVPAVDLEALVEAIQKSGQTPREFAARLLGKSGTRLGVQLDSAQKKEVRALFLSACEARLKVLQSSDSP